MYCSIETENTFIIVNNLIKNNAQYAIYFNHTHIWIYFFLGISPSPNKSYSVLSHTVVSENKATQQLNV